MAELKGINLATHLKSILAEFRAKESIYGYPKRKMYFGFPGIDLGVDFHGRRAETLLGPASGPHSQMAQNIVLAFLGGSRIIELKTVQILDQLDIPRPCIDIRNVGYNIEWSQELRLADSFKEYVTAWVLLKLLEESEILGIPKGSPFYDTVFDISVGYDLKGIQSPPMHNWLHEMQNAGNAIENILDTLPAEFRHLRNVKIDSNIANSVTLSTFHGCPAIEIESIVSHLISEFGFHLIVKMNPTILGFAAVDKILRHDLGYKNIQLDPQAFDHDISFAEAVVMMQRLEKFARFYNRNIGAKFTNTLVIKNNEDIFKDEIMYLSGAPLHVLAMTAMHQFRNAMGAHFHISFSAGITKHNFVDAVLCNMKPVTTCTDLLKEGGYTRLFEYLKRLRDAMAEAGCKNINDFILSQSSQAGIHEAGVENSNRIVPALIGNPLYHQNANQKTPPKIDSHLALFDCITCNKCLPVCPNAANFSIPTGIVDLPVTDYKVTNGKFEPVNNGRFVLTKASQIANLADFCNECGDCDTYCPEFGGPFIEKPRFFFDAESYYKFKKYDGFYFPDENTLVGRIDGLECRLNFNAEEKKYTWQNGEVELQFDPKNEFLSGKILGNNKNIHEVQTRTFFIMRTLFDGMKRNKNDYTSIMLILSDK